MANHMRSLIAAAAALVVLTPLYTTVSASEITCRVPFEFVVNGATLPAGHYAIGTTGAGAALLVHGYRKSAIVMTTLNDSGRNEIGRAKMVFLRTGERYTLIEVWTTDGLARAIPGARKSVEERALAMNRPVEEIVIAGM
jgi:hypothetical protein